MTHLRDYHDWLDKQRYRQDDRVGKFASWVARNEGVSDLPIPEEHRKGHLRGVLEFTFETESQPMIVLLGNDAIRYQQVKMQEAALKAEQDTADNLPVGEDTTGERDETVNEDTAGDAGGGTGDAGDGSVSES